MFEVKDIKLFGKTIEATGDDNEDPPCTSYYSVLQDSNNFNNDTVSHESPKQDDCITIPPIVEDSKTEEDTSNSILKKPDKIIPCPRCNSMDTKFCYFNNYNVNQPRHFCKNCQRYWTAGGTMRNVPVGAGRRKNKQTFSSDHAPLCESIVSIADKTISNGQSSKDEVVKNESHPQVPIFPGAPWPYPGGFPLPFYSTPPPPYWACALPGSWNIPWVIPQTSGPTLGKHSRDENVIEESRKESNPEKCLWVPKTLRIDEAAKSSIWATLGIKHDSVSGGSLFKAFQSQSKDDKKTSTVLQANPAALSRSLNFHESS